MAFNPNELFNKLIDGKVSLELDRRKGLASGETRSTDFRKWNYQKYCYIYIECLGENGSTFICSSPMVIGDGSINEQAGLDLYELEGGIRRSLPILKSVDISSDGGTRIEDATLWTAKVEFEVFTIDQLNRAEKAFLRAMSKVNIHFGWRNETAAPNSGVLSGDVSNFGFSANKDGSFACNFELVGENRLFSGETLEGVPDVTEEDVSTTTGKAVPLPNIVDAINIKHKKNFAIPSGEDYSATSTKQATINLSPSDSNYALANIPAAKSPDSVSFIGFGSDTQDLFVPYVTLGELVRHTNELMKGNDGVSQYTIICDGTSTIGAYVTELFSADPTTILLGGESADYGIGTENEMKFSGVLTEFPIDGNTANLSKIYISIPFLTTTFNNLKVEAKKNSSAAPSVKEFFRKIFEKIDILTGGLYQLTWYHDEEAPLNAYIVNKRPGYAGGANDGAYPFEVLGENSIIRNMSLSTTMDSDTAIGAQASARSGGTVDIPDDTFKFLYTDCNTESAVVEKTLVSAEQLSEQKKSYGDGFETSMVISVTDILKRYIVQNKDILGEEFRSSPGFFELTVSFDGIWGIPFYSRFRVDRLPSSYGDNLFFIVSKISHKFDGQGDWETEIVGQMQVKFS